MFVGSVEDVEHAIQNAVIICVISVHIYADNPKISSIYVARLQV